MTNDLPIAVIGAGPVGMAAAAQIVSRGLTPLVFEAGSSVASAMQGWAHVRVFSPWQYNVDAAARALLDASGWDAPEETGLPLRGEIIESYLRPLSELPSIAPHMRFNAKVSAITRRGLDKVSNAGREDAPFVISWIDADGIEQRSEARAVIDASGTWTKPNPIGTDGLPVCPRVPPRHLSYYSQSELRQRRRSGSRQKPPQVEADQPRRLSNPF